MSLKSNKQLEKSFSQNNNKNKNTPVISFHNNNKKGGKKMTTIQSVDESSDKETSPNSTKSSNLKKDINDIEELFTFKKETMKKRRIEQTLQQQQEEEVVEKEYGQKNNSFSFNKPNTTKKIDLAYTRDDTTKIQKGEWAQDGLGGVFDSDGWTGRIESGMKIYKHHLFNKKNAGQTKDCPFDCDCCYI